MPEMGIEENWLENVKKPEKDGVSCFTKTTLADFTFKKCMVIFTVSFSETIFP